MRIIEINGDRAVADMSGVRREVSIMTLPRIPNIGEFVVVHAGFAIEIVDEDKAKETLGAIAELESDLGLNEQN